jgi:beta-1,2-mannobiose phosphorylase / 1,2-beta-oligomannan phosphorylase
MPLLENRARRYTTAGFVIEESQRRRPRRLGGFPSDRERIKMLRRAFIISTVSALSIAFGRAPAAAQSPTNETSGGWRKYAQNPVLGGGLGVCFDVSLLRERDKYRMWFSWRDKKSVALVESADGIHWGPPAIVLGPNPATQWEEDINRPVVILKDDTYYMWYTGQAREHSWIGLATSGDGAHWTRAASEPVLAATEPWEKAAVMCPCVMWDESLAAFRMWYSGGEQYEPDAIGYATSPDGRRWTKLSGNPIFQSDPRAAWERYKVTGCQVLRRGAWHYMFYIGFRDIDHAQIGVARSRDGLTGWQRLAANPIIRPGIDQWDRDACYKPFAIVAGGRWLLWYNGRRDSVEQIGLAIHDSLDLGF